MNEEYILFLRWIYGKQGLVETIDNAKATFEELDGGDVNFIMAKMECGK